MAYWGNEPAKVAVKVGSDAITTTQIEDGQVYTADLQNDAVTASKIDDDGTGFQMGSLGLGTAVSGSHKLTVGGTATFSGDITGTLATSSQPNITSVGTIGTGVWQGTAVASAYLDADTAHLSGTQTFSGAKTFSANAVFNGEVLVNNTSSGNAKLYIKGGGTSTANSLYITDSAGADILYVKDNKSAKFYGTLETVGNVGIGASASFKFDTQDNSSTWAGRILNTNAGGQGLLVRTDATNGATALGVYANGAYRLTVTDSSSTFAGQILGSASGVAYSFTGDPDTGVQSGGTNTLQITTAGAKALDFDANQLATFAGAIAQDGGDTFAHFGRGDSDSRIILGSQGGTYSSGSTNAFNNFRAHSGGMIFNVASSDDTFVFEHNGTSKLTLSPTTATFAGNMTVSGTGTNTFYGLLSIEKNAGYGSTVDLLKLRNSGAGNTRILFNNYSTTLCTITGETNDVSTGSYDDGTLQFHTAYNGVLSNRLQIENNGTLVGSATNDISDGELKKNIKNITNGIDTIKQLQGRTFEWKVSASMPDGVKYGLIAQELEEVLPHLVYDKTGIRQKADGSWYKSIAMSGVIPVLIEAVKELSAKVEALEST